MPQNVVIAENAIYDTPYNLPDPNAAISVRCDAGPVIAQVLFLFCVFSLFSTNFYYII